MSLKICHISDIHWRGLERHNEYRFVLDKLYDLLEVTHVDLIINTGDTWHTKLQHITPEAISAMRNMFAALRTHAPVISIYGNHDLNLQNRERYNIIKEIIDVEDNKISDDFGCKLLDLSKRHTVTLSNNREVVLYPFSMTDAKNWDSLREERKNRPPTTKESYEIALFHGSVANVELQNGYNLKEGELEKDNFIFNEFPFVFLGDIHKRQQLAFRRDHENNLKPYVAYAGSLIQQDFGETVEGHGGIIWDFNSPEDWNLIDFDIENPYQRHSVSWEGLEKTYEQIKTVYETNKLDRRASFRVQHGGVIFSSEAQELKQMVKMNLTIDNDIQFAHSKAIERQLEELIEIKPNVVVKSNRDLLTEFIEQNGGLKKAIREEDYDLLFETIDALEKENKQEESTLNRSVWKLKELWFDNIFSYGEGNYINFESLSGNVGLFGSNRTGKSSVLGAICYTLFNGTDRGPVKNFYVINEHKKACRAKAIFEINGETYCVERSTKRSTKNEVTNTKVNFYMMKDGVKTKNLNGDSRDETDKKIRDIIGIYQDFENTSFASQHELLTFIRKGSAEYKKVLSRYFNIDSYLSLGVLATKKKEKLAGLIAGRTEETVKSNLLQKEEEIISLTKVLEAQNLEADVLKKAFEEAKERLASINVESHKEYHSNEQLLRSNHEEDEQNTIKLKELQAKSVELMSSIEKIKEERDALTVVIADKKKFDDKTQELLTALNGHKKNREGNVIKLKLLDEIPCGTQFPNCSFIKDSFSAQEKIDWQDKLIENLEESLAAVQGMYVTLGNDPDKRYAEANRSFNEASRGLAAVDQQIDSITNRIEKLKASNQKLQARQIELEKIKANENVDEQIKVLTDAYSVINHKYSECLVNQKSTIMEISFKKKEKEELSSKFEELSLLMKNFRVMSIIAEAYSKNGIPAQILRDYMDSVNFFSGLVTKDTDFDVKVRVDSESNSLDIDYVFKGKSRPLETCSGAEKTFAALALRIALIQCSSIPTCNVLFLDECFGSLDDSMLVVAGQLLSSLECYFDVIFIISHEAYMKEMASDSLEIQREDGFSLVQTAPMKITEWIDV